MNETEIENLLIILIRGNSQNTIDSLELQFRAATKETPENRLLIFKRGIDPPYEEVRKIKLTLEKILQTKTEKEPVVHGNIFGYILKWKTPHTQLPIHNLPPNRDKNERRNRKN